MSKVICGVNGFGRFGLHLLNYYLDLIDKSNFEIQYINDDILDINQALDIIVHDPYVQIYKNFEVKIEDDFLIFNDTHKIKYTCNKTEDIKWLGTPDILLECTGKFTNAELARKFKIGNTKKVLISATSFNADKTLVYGFNHLDYSESDDVISYGSCTVNAYIPLTAFMHENFGVMSSDVNVIHNIPEYQLKDGLIETPGLPRVPLLRKSCTLSNVAPKLLDFVEDENFNVNYTLIPYTGVSIIDFRYNLDEVPDDGIWKRLQKSCESGELKGLYAMQEDDNGPHEHQNTEFSSVIIKKNSYIRGNDLYLNAYFDNENSVNRYYDLTNFISSKIS
tara:strand:- start:1233 stop:2237 length:1005 start_codon:yes stop_codon:yes gene_type:complete